MSASHPEGEIDELIGMKANTPIVPSTPSAPTSSSQAAKPPAPAPPPAAKPAEKRIQKPSQWVADLLDGHGHTNCIPR